MNNFNFVSLLVFVISIFLIYVYILYPIIHKHPECIFSKDAIICVQLARITNE